MSELGDTFDRGEYDPAQHHPNVAPEALLPASDVTKQTLIETIKAKALSTGEPTMHENGGKIDVYELDVYTAARPSEKISLACYVEPADPSRMYAHVSTDVRHTLSTELSSSTEYILKQTPEGSALEKYPVFIDFGSIFGDFDKAMAEGDVEKMAEAIDTGSQAMEDQILAMRDSQAQERQLGLTAVTEAEAQDLIDKIYNSRMTPPKWWSRQRVGEIVALLLGRERF